jgi:hypothetical protein
MSRTGFLPLVFPLSLAFFAQLTPAQQYQILYTGRTLGYARMPNSEHVDLPSDTNQPNSIFAEAYQSLFDTAQKGESSGIVLRLGMGENFAPNLFSRTFQERGPNDFRQTKDRFVWDDHNKRWVKWNDKYAPKEDPTGKNEIESDNVAKFFVAEGYNAIVPGPVDFYFGAERIRELEGMLGQHGVHMLAANLFISTTRSPQVLNAYPRIPERYNNHEGRFLTDFGGVAIDLPDQVLPWKRVFVIKNVRQLARKNAAVNKLWGAEDFDPDDPDDPNDPRARKANLVDYKYFLKTEEGKKYPEAYICHDPHREPGEATTSTAQPDRDQDPDAVRLPGELGSDCWKLVLAEDKCKDARSLEFAKYETTCKALFGSSGVYKEDQTTPSPDAKFIFEDPAAEEPLLGGQNHLFCAHPIADILEQKPPADPKKEKWTCKPFAVQMPFFSWGHSPKPDPFVVVGPAGGPTHVAVFGVVDPNLLLNVGMLNASWYNAKDHLNSVVQVAGADYSLLQALDLCNQREDCRTASKVLMAQMSRAQAAQLISSKELTSVFDAVITQADRAGRTGYRTLTTSSCSTEGPQFILTPADPGEATVPRLNPSVYRATITKADHVDDNCNQFTAPQVNKHTTWTLNNEVFEQRVNEPPVISGVSLADASRTALMKLKAYPDPAQVAKKATVAPGSSQPVRDLMLLAMQRYRRTDVALLQERDFFSPDKLSSQPIPATQVQNQINRILWKGDFVMTLHVKGATLRKLMKQSAKFAELDHDSLNTDLEKGRSLVTLGLFQDPKDTDIYYVDGTRLDDAALYSVAATEYLSLGDTGYSDLATPDVPPARRVQDATNQRSVGGLLCDALLANGGIGSFACDEDIADAGYYDPISQQPLDATPGFSTAKHYATFEKRLTTGLPEKAAQGAENSVQQRHFFAVNLESSDFTYTGNYINHASATVNSLAGVATTGLQPGNGSALSADHKLRGIYDFSRGTLYLLNDSNYSRTAASAAGMITIALPSNTVGFEAGGTFRLFKGNHPARPLQGSRPSWLSYQYSLRYERQLVTPVPTTVAVNDPNCLVTTIASGNCMPATSANYLTSATLSLPNPKLSSVYGRPFGLRMEFGDTYLETGWEEVVSYHVLSSYTFNGLVGSTNGLVAPVGPVTCLPDSVLQFFCAASNAGGIATDTRFLGAGSVLTPVVNKANYLTSGVYLNFKMKFPLWSRKDAANTNQTVYFQLTNKGDLYFNSPSDTDVQTRYLDTLTPSITFPIYGKFTLTPKVDFLLYQNKADLQDGAGRNHYRSVSPAVSLSYTFKWRQGMGFLNTLRYGAIATPPPSGASQ